MSKFAVKLSNISKKFVVHHEKPTLVENILQRKTKEEFWALRNIQLSIKKGEKVGIIGSNGAGKTTLLKIIAGITTPTAGVLRTQGKVVSLIGLAAGFQPDLTGEENIMLSGLLIGMSKDEIKAKMNEIIKFADIGTFIDASFYTYSSGMALRLGFSIAVQADPDILILDDTLAVGDKDFQKKSFNKIQEFFSQGRTIILVSHQLKFLQQNCDRLIWLYEGRIVKKGKASQIIRMYKKGSVSKPTQR